MKKSDSTIVPRLFAIYVLMTMVGCGQQLGNNLPPKQAEAVAALEALGVAVSIRDDEVTLIDFYSTQDTASAVVHLEPFVGLKKINFGGTEVTDDELAHLGPLVNLEELALKGSRVTDAGLKHVAGLSKLVVLNLDNCSITDEGLVHLKGLSNLKRLHLNKSRVSDAGLTHLTGLKNLESFLAYGTQVTAAGADTLRQSLPNLNVVTPKLIKDPKATTEGVE